MDRRYVKRFPSRDGTLGPVVAGAVILPQNYKLRGLNDSKKILDPERRDELAHQIKQDAICWSAGFAEVEEIDKINIYHAGLLAMQRALEGLGSQPDFVLVDARKIPNCSVPQRGIIRGDSLSASIAAASIIAKTTRDAHMIKLDGLYEGYGLASHKGYPTPEHCRALALGALLSSACVRRCNLNPVRGTFGNDDRCRRHRVGSSTLATDRLRPQLKNHFSDCHPNHGSVNRIQKKEEVR